MHSLSAPDPAAGQHWPTPPPETSGHSQASLGPSPVGSLLLSPGSWWAQGFVCALQESVSPVLYKFWRFYGGVNGDFLQVGLCHIQVYWTQSPCPSAVDCWPYFHRRHSNTVLSQSLWDLWVLVCTSFVSALWASLAGMGFDSKHDFAPPTIFLELPLCPLKWGISSKPLQCSAAATPVPTVLMVLHCHWTWGIFSKSLQQHAATTTKLCSHH